LIILAGSVALQKLTRQYSDPNSDKTSTTRKFCSDNFRRFIQ
jgi:hypothetical protein